MTSCTFRATVRTSSVFERTRRGTWGIWGLRMDCGKSSWDSGTGTEATQMQAIASFKVSSVSNSEAEPKDQVNPRIKVATCTAGFPLPHSLCLPRCRRLSRSCMTFPITACPQNHASLLCWALASSNSAASAVTVGGTRYQAEESGFLLSRGPFFESQSAEKIREQWFCSSGFGVSERAGRGRHRGYSHLHLLKLQRWQIQSSLWQAQASLSKKSLQCKKAPERLHVMTAQGLAV